MPTYAYICQKCGHSYDLFERITAKPNKTCPKCKSKKAERQISGGAGLIFKGTGFYTTDYKQKIGKSEAKKDSSSSKPASDSSSGACDTKSSGT